jgi:hypothetical protein
MKSISITLAALAVAAATSGCSSFKMGAACYVPHGVTGQCQATTVAPAAQR